MRFSFCPPLISPRLVLDIDVIRVRPRRTERFVQEGFTS